MPFPLRSLLLTFDQLAPEQVATSKGTMTLSQHYRPLEGWRSIIGEQQQDDLHELKLLVVTNDKSDCNLPNIPLKVTSSAQHDLKSNLQQHLQPTNCQNRISWVHVANNVDYRADEVGQIIASCRSCCSAETLFAVTAFQMHWEQIDHQFDVIANDNLMRVPAILEQAGFAEFHLQAITSSHDLLHTLLQHAHDQPLVSPLEQKRSAEVSGPNWDLRQLAVDPETSAERNLTLRFGRFRAIRTQNFLYVAEVDRDSSSRTAVREGLYLKPQDRWNVHNVCSEYVEKADLMRNQIGLI